MKKSSYFATILIGILSFLIIVNFIAHPKEIFESSLRGLKIWWDVVFPALLPFVIVAELMMGLGLAHFFGVLLEPIMRPLFNVPGAGAFALTMGFASGYPLGAKLTVRLREQQLITRSEGERLVSFVSTSDPLFMFGAVAVGFFQDVRLGLIFATIHYATSLVIGMMMRFHDRHAERTVEHENSSNLLMRALQAMHNARIMDGRSFGKLMGDAVSSSLQTLLLVGGLLIIFSVMMTIFSYMYITPILAQFFALILSLFGLSSDLQQALINGLFEVTLGAQAASIAHAPLVESVVIASAILAWGGLSVHAQVSSILATTDIRYKPYLLARVIHAALAALITFLTYPFFIQSTMTISRTLDHIPSPYAIQSWEVITVIFLRSIGLLCLLVFISLLVQLIKKIRFRKP